jgi:hypothetical protein
MFRVDFPISKLLGVPLGKRALLRASFQCFQILAQSLLIVENLLWLAVLLFGVIPGERCCDPARIAKLGEGYLFVSRHKRSFDVQIRIYIPERRLCSMRFCS